MTAAGRAPAICSGPLLPAWPTSVLPHTPPSLSKGALEAQITDYLIRSDAAQTNFRQHIMSILVRFDLPYKVGAREPFEERNAGRGAVGPSRMLAAGRQSRALATIFTSPSTDCYLQEMPA